MPALVAGLGIADLPEFIVGDAIASGAVEVILKGWKQPEGALHWVTPPGGPRPARVEVLAEFLAEAFREGEEEITSSSSPRTRGPIPRNLSIGASGRRSAQHRGLWLWVPDRARDLAGYARKALACPGRRRKRHNLSSPRRDFASG